jgi:hypothetical protein
MQPIQLGLFDDWTLRLQRSRRVLLESLDLETAREELTTLLGRSADAEAERLATTVAAIESALASRLRADGDLVAALLRLEPDIPEWLRAGWHRRLTLEAEHRDGIGCQIGAETAGWHFLRAGDLREAARSLRATLERAPTDARSRAQLADVFHLQGDLAAARVEYLRALLDGPETVDWKGIIDPDVTALPSIAASEHQVPGDPVGWAAAVGTVEGVLPWPAAVLPGVDLPSGCGEGHPGIQFYRLLCVERQRHDLTQRAHIRRQMKALCPSLLAGYLERWR